MWAKKSELNLADPSRVVEVSDVCQIAVVRKAAEPVCSPPSPPQRTLPGAGWPARPVVSTLCPPPATTWWEMEENETKKT